MSVNIPSASEMAAQTQEILDNKVAGLMEKIVNGLQTAITFNATISLSEEDEKIVHHMVKFLEDLEYKVTYTPGYFEDRPCGGHVNGKIVLDWTPPESGW